MPRRSSSVVLGQGRLMITDTRNGAVLYSCRNRPDASRRQNFNRLFRQKPRRNVDV